MCVPSAGGGGDGGAAAREAERQQQIQAGYDKINQIFGGTPHGVGDVAAPAAGQSYYLDNGTSVPYASQTERFRQLSADAQAALKGGGTYNGITAIPQPVRGGGGKGGTPKPVDPTRGQYSVGGYTDSTGKFVPLGTSSLHSGVSSEGGFDQNFYDQRSKDYVDFATPQLDDQFGQAVKKLTFALSRNGLLDSSVYGDQMGLLQKQFDTQKTGIADKGLQYANDARTNVENSRSDLVNMNNNLADPNAIAQEAGLRMQGLMQAQSFDPLAPLFTNVGEDLGTQASLERRQQAQYSTGLFTPSSSGSGRYIS